ncbi:MAG: DUF2752 domain-containing protein [Verrucomicrobiia bacterium]|jgi:hypothetical protein
MKNLCGSLKVLEFKITNSISLCSKQKKSGILVIAASLVGLILFSLAYYYYGSAFMKLIPPCILYTTTGIQCPICGSQRAIYFLLHGNFSEALRMNGFAIILLVIAVLVYFKSIYDYYLRNKTIRLKLIWIYALAVFAILFTIFRNL